MNYNAIISCIDVSDESGLEEPVTLQEIKDYLRLEGYTDLDESTSDDLSDFDYDDDLIEETITACRQLMEEKSNMSLVNHTWEAEMQSMGVKQLLAYTPASSVISVVDEDDVELDSDNYKVKGLEGWTYITLPCGCWTVTYESSPEVPKSIKLDLMRLVAYMYENRGDDPAIESFASQLVKSYSRKLPIV